MGNVIPSKGHRHGHVKVMKLDGEILKFKAPITAKEIVQNYPNHVILHSEAVRHLGVRAKPLEESTHLKTKQLYFLVALPRLDDYRVPRRVSSEIKMNAKSRLESMLLARRSVSDISMVMGSSSHGNPPSSDSTEKTQLMSVESSGQGDDGSMRLKVRLTKSQLAKFMAESENSSETAERILDLCLNDAEAQQEAGEEQKVPHSGGLIRKPALGSIPENCKRAQRGRVRFSSVQNGEVF